MKEKITFKYVPVETLIPYARNARIHTDAQVAEIAGSIVEFGFNVPVLIDRNNNLIAGHGRVLAARKLGMEEVPAVVAEHLTDIQRRAFILADNKLHDNSRFDYEILGLELDELKVEGFDISLIGFENFELESFSDQVAFNPDSFFEPIDTPEKPAARVNVCPHCGMEI